MTLYHWDLPQELEDAGGWPARDTAYRFAEYAMLVFDALGTGSNTWTTLNEPWCSAMLGYAYGAARPGPQGVPGTRSPPSTTCCSATGSPRPRCARRPPRKLELGITLNLGTAVPGQRRRAGHRGRAAAPTAWAPGSTSTRWCTAATRPTSSPTWPPQGIELPVQDGDLAAISAPIDVLGVNYYFSQKFSGSTEDGRTDRRRRACPSAATVPLDQPRTAMDWEIVPEGFTDLLVRLARDYPGLPMVITENGAAFDDTPDADGFVADDDRTAYFAAHMAAVADALKQGADVRGYFAWSLMDNFEWAYGYDKRFGIVRVDYDTQTRTPKQSALYLKSLAEAHRAR